MTYPMIGDPELKVGKLYGMFPAESGDFADGRTAADNATVRSVFVIGPDKKIKLRLTYPRHGPQLRRNPARTGFLQLTAKHTVATPVNWKPGHDVIIPPAVSDEVARQKFPVLEIA